MPTRSSIKVVPKEALDYLQSKGLKPGKSYDAVWREEHNNAFTVAGITNKRVLADIRKSLVKALAEGQPYGEWAKGVHKHFVKLGWDSDTNVAPRRVRTVFETNMRVAQAVGQWDRIQKTKSALPYLKYMLGPSERHREQHVKFAGTCLPVGHPWWDTHFPPNGYGCQCWVLQLTKGQAKQQGITDDANLDDTMETYIDPDGVAHDVPIGIQPGWDYNPGKTRMEHLLEYAENMGPETFSQYLQLHELELALAKKQAGWTVSKNGKKYYYTPYVPKGGKKGKSGGGSGSAPDPGQAKAPETAPKQEPAAVPITPATPPAPAVALPENVKGTTNTPEAAKAKAAEWQKIVDAHSHSGKLNEKDLAKAKYEAEYFTKKAAWLEEQAKPKPNNTAHAELEAVKSLIQDKYTQPSQIPHLQAKQKELEQKLGIGPTTNVPTPTPTVKPPEQKKGGWVVSATGKKYWKSPYKSKKTKDAEHQASLGPSIKGVHTSVRKWKEDLRQNAKGQHQAVQSWIGAGYTGFRKADRGDEGVSTYQHQQLAVLKKALESAPRYQGELYRGLKLNTPEKQAHLVVGETIHERALASYSPDLRVAKSFAGTGGVVLKFNSTSGNGRHIQTKGSQVGSETEVMLPKGGFKITHIETITPTEKYSQPYKVVHVEEIPGEW